jgi:hypothetical protein
MRSKLMSTAAIVALSVSGVVALAQDRSPAATGAEKSAPAEKSQASPSRAAEPKSSAQTGADSPKERSPTSAERAAPAHSATEPRSAAETKGNESKPAGTRATETKPSEQKSNESRTSETAKPTEAKPAEHKPEQRTGETKPSTTSGDKNAASEPKAPRNSRGQPEPEKSNAESTPNQRNEPNKTAAPNAPAPANPSASTGNTRSNSAGSTAPAGGAGSQTGATGPNNPSGTAAPGTAGTSGSQTNVNASANLQPQQQSKIVETLRSHRSEAVTNVNFTVNVGATVPESVRYHPLPEDIVSIVPQYRGYHYVMVRDEVVIIEPRTRRIVNVIHQGAAGASVRRTSLNLPTEKRRKIKTEVIRSYHGPRDGRFDLRVGERVPDTIMLETFPQTIFAEDPELKTYEYVVVQERVVLVDPQSREVVEILD